MHYSSYWPAWLDDILIQIWIWFEIPLYKVTQKILGWKDVKKMYNNKSRGDSNIPLDKLLNVFLFPYQKKKNNEEERLLSRNSIAMVWLGYWSSVILWNECHRLYFRRIISSQLIYISCYRPCSTCDNFQPFIFIVIPKFPQMIDFRLIQSNFSGLRYSHVFF